MKNELFVVYKMKIALKLIDQGHKVAYTMANPKNEKYTTWVFRVDETFMEDLEEAVSAERRSNNGN